MASYIDGLAPAGLRGEVPARAEEAAGEGAAALRRSRGAGGHEELGAPPEEVFAEWEREPFAAASIGQVHRAVTQGGDASP